MDDHDLDVDVDVDIASQMGFGSFGSLAKKRKYNPHTDAVAGTTSPNAPGLEYGMGDVGVSRHSASGQGAGPGGATRFSGYQERSARSGSNQVPLGMPRGQRPLGGSVPLMDGHGHGHADAERAAQERGQEQGRTVLEPVEGVGLLSPVPVQGLPLSGGGRTVAQRSFEKEEEEEEEEEEDHQPTESSGVALGLQNSIYNDGADDATNPPFNTKEKISRQRERHHQEAANRTLPVTTGEDRDGGGMRGAALPDDDGGTTANLQVGNVGAVRRGFRDQKGDMAYYDKSFVEDPWRELRAGKPMGNG